MDYFEETKMMPLTRSLDKFSGRVKIEYGAIQEVGGMGRLTEILSFRRKNHMNIRSFWQHMRRLILYAKQNGVIPPGISYLLNIFVRWIFLIPRDT